MVTEEIEKRLEEIKSTIAKESTSESVEAREVNITPEVLIIGGGITGMYAALDVADAGFKVHLVERSPTIGGHMAQLDKTFPTLDCSDCIITPRMVDVGAHPNIDLMTCSEVVEVKGSVGNFEVKVKRRATYVDATSCTGCDLCAQACRLKNRFPNEFDQGLLKRAPVYIPFAYGIPPVYTIDPNQCLMVSRGKCGKATLDSSREARKKKEAGEEVTDKEAPPCMVACGPNSIDFDMKERTVNLKVGTIIVSTGYDIIPPDVQPEFKYGVYPNVIHGFEFERYSCASGPTEGKVINPANGKEPKTAVFIHCVGSRNKQTGYEYCSRVCCMYLAKQAHLLLEKLPDCKIYVLYQDIRAFGKAFEEFYDRVKAEGINYIRGLAGEIYKTAGSDTVRVRGEDTMLGEPFEIEADLVVLGVGLRPSDGVEEVTKVLNLPRDDLEGISNDKFFAEAQAKLRPIETGIEGVYIAGCCQGPKDIPDSVAQGKAAAAASIALIAQGKAKIEPAILEMKEDLIASSNSLTELSEKIR